MTSPTVAVDAKESVLEVSEARAARASFAGLVGKQFFCGILSFRGFIHRIANLGFDVRRQPSAFACPGNHLVSYFFRRGSDQVMCRQSMISHDLCDGLLAEVSFDAAIHYEVLSRASFERFISAVK